MSDNYSTYSGPTGTGGSGGSSGTGGGGSGTKGSGGGGGTDPYTAAIRAQNRKEAAAKHKAAQRYKKQAQVLQNQVGAIRYALSSKGFMHALQTRLANAGLVYRQQDQVLMDTYKTRVHSLEGAAEDNEKARAGQSVAALANRGRERANALSEVAAQGAGETDQLRAQGMSLRNWNANQNEVNRSYFDTLRSVNSSLNDLNADTKTGRTNLLSQLNADKDQLWTQYYNQRSDSYTQLGNIFGQQADLLSQAQEMQSTKKTRRQMKRKNLNSRDAFMSAAKASSSAWQNPGIPASLMNWTGQEEFDGTNNQSLLANAQTVTATARPEGATLRSWET